MRRLDLAGGDAILSDTVGFISDLPTMLIAAFRATLEEVLEADLILHVRDIAAPFSEKQKHDVEAVLSELGVEVEGPDSRIVEVWNKIDQLDDDQRQALVAHAERLGRAPVLVSARSGEGLEALRRRIGELLARDHITRVFDIDSRDGVLTHWLYEHSQICAREDHEDGTTRITARLAAADLERFEHLRSARAAEGRAG
jgi:GTPase